MVSWQGGDRGDYLNFTRNLQHAGFGEHLHEPTLPKLSPDSHHEPSRSMVFYCYEGKCPSESDRKSFPSQQALRQHRVRVHRNELPQDSSVGRVLKRKRVVEAEELRKRQRLEEEERVAASYVPEPPQVCHRTRSWQKSYTQEPYLQSRSLSWNRRSTLDSHVRRGADEIPPGFRTTFQRQRSRLRWDISSPRSNRWKQQKQEQRPLELTVSPDHHWMKKLVKTLATQPHSRSSQVPTPSVSSGSTFLPPPITLAMLIPLPIYVLHHLEPPQCHANRQRSAPGTILVQTP